jgi:hypothetical protein
MKRIMSNNGCALPSKLRTQLKVDAKQDLDTGAPRIGNHVDVQVCKFKSFKGLFPELVYSKKNYKQQASTNTPPSSLMDSTLNPNVKTTEEGVGAHSLVCSTLGVEGCAGAPR